MTGRFTLSTLADESVAPVSDWLGEEFEEGSKDEVVTLLHIEDFVKKKPAVNRVLVELPTEQLVEAVSKRFPTSAYDKEVDTRAIFRKLRSKATCPLQFVDQCATVSSGQIAGGTEPMMCIWTVDDVGGWLARLGVGCDAIEQFHLEKINGRVLERITLAELEKVFTCLRFGERKTIMLEIYAMKERKPDADECRSKQRGTDKFSRVEESEPTSPRSLSLSLPDDEQTMSSTKPKERVDDTRQLRAVSTSAKTKQCSEVCRTFDRDVRLMDKYTHHDILSCNEGQPHNLLQPIHRFVDIDLSTNEGTFTLASETIRFVCACLNDRTNGTLHFGVSSRTSATKLGEVLGTTLKDDKQMYEEYVMKAVSRCFVPEQRDVALACMRPLKFIEVVPTHDAPRFVVEIDVVPSYSFCQEEAFFILVPWPRKRKGDVLQFDRQAVYRWIESNPTEVRDDELVHFMKFKQKLAETRKEREQDARQTFDKITYSMSKDRLINLLCIGEDGFIGDVYPILVINKPDAYMDQSYMRENMNFLHTIEWKAVFDFDSKSAVCDFITSQDQLIKISTTADDFYSRSSENINDPDRVKRLQEDIRNSIPYQWIFVNGNLRSGVDSNDPYSWKKQKREGFRKAVEFFASEIPAGRAIIVFVLLSKDWKVMLEASEEFFSAFPDQWMCIAKEEAVSQPWNEELLRRHSIDKEAIENRTIDGMPWEHVQEAVQQIRGPERYAV